MNSWRKFGCASLAAVPLLIASRAYPQQQHMIQNEREAKWSDAPPMLPPGAKIDVVQGNPTGPVEFTYVNPADDPRNAPKK